MTPACDTRCHQMSAAGLCDRCAHRLKADLIELEQLYVTLTLERRRSNTDPVSGSKDPPAPADLDALCWIGPAAEQLTDQGRAVPDDQDDTVPLIAVVQSWARLIAEERELVGRIENPMLFLLRHHAWATRQPWADDYAQEIGDQVRTGRRLARTGRITYRLDTPCPACNVRALVREDGSHWVDCRACGGGWDPERWPVEHLEAS